jgi:protein-S-isoprenylcysteine O-methyltransferase Ste14
MENLIPLNHPSTPPPTIGYLPSYLPPGGTPTLFTITIVVCVYLEYFSSRRIRPLYQTTATTTIVIKCVGLLIGLIAASNSLSSLNAMRQTGVLHSKPTLRIIKHGCFQTCRNPIYSFIVWLYFALAIVYNSRCILGGACFCLVYLAALVVPAEEVFLLHHFPKEYTGLLHNVECRWCWYPTLC